MNDLEQRLHDLGDAVTVPATPLADDLARGRARVRRRRAGVAGAALATAAIVVGGWALVPDSGQPSSREGSVAGASERRTGDSTPSPLDGKRRDQPDEMKLLRAWNDIVAEHVDPSRRHLQRMTKDNWNVQSVTDDHGVYVLGSKYGWADATRPGLGVLQLSVGSARDELLVDSPCMREELRCTETAASTGTTRVLVGRGEGVLSVLVDRADGHVVALTYDPLFGNNSLVPVDDPGPSVDALVAAATDERIALP